MLQSENQNFKRYIKSIDMQTSMRNCQHSVSSCSINSMNYLKVLDYLFSFIVIILLKFKWLQNVFFSQLF